MTAIRRLRLDPVDAAGRPTLAWWILIGLVAVTLFSVTVPLLSTAYAIPVAIALALGALQCGALVLAPAQPVIAIVLFVASVYLTPRFSDAAENTGLPWPWTVPAMIAGSLLLTLLVFYRSWRNALWAFLLGVAVSVAVAIEVTGDTERIDGAIINIVIAASITGAFLVLSLLVAQRERIRAELLTERRLSAAEQSRRELAEERQRIARELHDVVAHGMSIIQVQATTARYRLPELDPAAAAEFDEIGASAREAMIEMRRLLGVLRSETDDAELAPQRGIDELRSLVDGVARAGAEIAIDEAPLPGGLASSVSVAAFRIAQEAISNAIRHAPGGAIRVSTEISGDHLVLSVVNGPMTRVAVSTSGGHGLVGMRERAALLGGTLEAGPDAAGGYRVRAVLPLRAAPSPEETP